jgi:hypothetical protein
VRARLTKKEVWNQSITKCNGVYLKKSVKNFVKKKKIAIIFGQVLRKTFGHTENRTKE